MKNFYDYNLYRTSVGKTAFFCPPRRKDVRVFGQQVFAKSMGFFICCAILKLLYILFTNQSLIHSLNLKQNSYWVLFSENFYKTPSESVETEGIKPCSIPNRSKFLSVFFIPGHRPQAKGMRLASGDRIHTY